MVYTTGKGDRVHTFVTNNNLVMIHTKENLTKGDTLLIGKRFIQIETLKATNSNYFKGLNFYEINFNDKKAGSKMS